MNINDLFTLISKSDSEWFLPLDYVESTDDFLGFILKKIIDYVNLVKNMDEKCIDELNHAFDFLPKENKPIKQHDFIRDLQAVADITKEVLQLSYRSFHEEAFESWKAFFEADDYFYLNLFPQLSFDKGALYRIRTGIIRQEKDADGEMFHIPFEKRYLVSTQRFSIPGYPALYLAGSFFTAWCELDKPRLDNLTYVFFRPKNPLLFLDLGLPYNDNPALWEKYSLFVTYPVLMACMTRVKYQNAPFKPEYLMPQLMMKLVREHTKVFRGISYVSNKIPWLISRKSIETRNFVLCVNNTICCSGYDKDLAEMLQMSDFKYVEQNDLKHSVNYDKGTYAIVFNKLKLHQGDVHDIKVKMKN